MVIKTCSKCKQDKPAEDFHKGKAQCKECVKEYSKAYYRQHTEKINQSNRAWKKQNRDKVRIYERSKRKTDSNFKLTQNLRRRVRKTLNGKSKSKNTMDLIGCSVDFLKKHIESQFEPGMSWDNYGVDGWLMYHIVPCASFDLSDPEQQQKCFNYTNLQPLRAKDNISKSAKLDWNKL